MKKLDRPQFTADHYAHLEQLPIIKAHLEVMKAATAPLPIHNSPGFTAMVQRIQVSHFLFTLLELNGAILRSVEERSYTAAEALARVAIEMSANLMFLLGGETHGRSKGLLKHHLEMERKRSKNWLTYATENRLSSEQAARDQMQDLDALDEMFAGLADPPFEKWPKQSKEKFVGIGHEERYQTLFSSSSDAIHLQGADILNVTICNFQPKEEQPAVIRGMHAEKVSFAVYLLLSSVVFHAECLGAVMERVQAPQEAEAEMQVCYDTLVALLDVHERDHRKHRPTGG